MPEIEQEVKTFNIDYQCDNCRNGYMQCTGVAFPKFPAIPTIFEHQCDNCGHVAKLNTIYPRVTYKSPHDERTLH